MCAGGRARAASCTSAQPIVADQDVAGRPATKCHLDAASAASRGRSPRSTPREAQRGAHASCRRVGRSPKKRAPTASIHTGNARRHQRHVQRRRTSPAPGTAASCTGPRPSRPIAEQVGPAFEQAPRTGRSARQPNGSSTSAASSPAQEVQRQRRHLAHHQPADDGVAGPHQGRQRQQAAPAAGVSFVIAGLRRARRRSSSIARTGRRHGLAAAAGRASGRCGQVAAAHRAGVPAPRMLVHRRAHHTSGSAWSGGICAGDAAGIRALHAGVDARAGAPTGPPTAWRSRHSGALHQALHRSASMVPERPAPQGPAGSWRNLAGLALAGIPTTDLEEPHPMPRAIQIAAFGGPRADCKIVDLPVGEPGHPGEIRIRPSGLRPELHRRVPAHRPVPQCAAAELWAWKAPASSRRWARASRT